MRLKRIFRIDFLKSFLYKQNKWHAHGVFLHTMYVVYYVLKNKEYKMLAAAFLHDIAKPIIAYQNNSDKTTGEYSFTNHEEISYQIVKNWPLSTYTKKLIRYHYLLRGMSNSKKRNQMGKYHRMKRSYDSLSDSFKEDLTKFMIFDDLAKK